MDLVRHVSALFATWRGRFIALFIAVQMIAPLTYYVARRDPHDERFAWRMFSPMRMTRCSTEITVGGEHVDLGAKFHEAWLELASRGRYVVLEAMAAKLCKENPGKAVGVSVDCRYIDRPAAHLGGPDLCTHPEL